MTKQEKTAVFAAAANLLLTIGKLILASISGSIALFADAYHSFTDVLASCLVWIALKLDKKDKENIEENKNGNSGKIPRLIRPGGWSDKAAIALGIFLIIIGIHIFIKVRQSTLYQVEYPLRILPFVLIMAFVSNLIGRIEKSVGEKTKTSALVADGHHAHVDSLTTLLVGISLVCERFNLGVDRIAAGIIGVLIFANAIHVLKHGIKSYIAHGRELESLEDSNDIFENAALLWIGKGIAFFKELFFKFITGLPFLSTDEKRAVQQLKKYTIYSLIILAVIVFIGSGFYTVPPDSKAIVERFGIPVNIDKPAGPGLHYHMPRPFSKARIVPTDFIQNIRVGFDAKDSTEYILWTNKHYIVQYSMLTGEGAFVDLAMEIHYKISDIGKYLYSSIDPVSIAKSMAYQIIRAEVGTEEFFTLLTVDRDVLEDKIRERLQIASDKEELGFDFISICLRDMHPPVDVAPAFEDVVSAQEDYETYIEEAVGYKKDIIPKSRGISSTTVANAEAYASTKINTATGEGNAFINVVDAYNEFPDINRFRLWLDTVSAIYSEVPVYLISPDIVKSGQNIVFGKNIMAPQMFTEDPGRNNFNNTNFRDETDLMDTVRNLRNE